MSEEALTEVSLVIPAYNEEARLAPLLDVLADDAERDLRSAGLRFVEAVIVDDGSTDATSGLLHAASHENRRLRPLLGRTVNRGKGAALAAGVELARAEMVLLVDVDLSTPLSEAHRLTEAMAETGAEIAIGSRKQGGRRVVAPRHRRVLGSAFNLAVRMLTGLDYADTQCGFKLMGTAAARDLLRDQLSTGFAFDVELLVRAQIAGLSVVEVPVSYLHDDRSKVGVLSASVRMARDLARIALRLRLDAGRARRGPRPESGMPLGSPEHRDSPPGTGSPP